MRKLSLLVILALLLSVVPAFAQEATPEAALPTLAELVVASSTAETPEFTLLLTAVQAADPAVLEALSNPESDLTVFAPTDAAFLALQETIGEEAFAAVLADPKMLTDILLFHVIEGSPTSEELIGGLTMVGGAIAAPTLQGQAVDVALTEEGGITVNGASVVAADIEASNGIVHVIDAVILPETRTIAEIVVESAADAENPQFATLLAAVQAADPAVLELLSDPEARVTVFAPTDAAFAAVGEETLSAVLADQALLTSILQYHVAPSIVRPFIILQDMDMLTAAMGEDGLSVDSALEGQPLTVKAGMGETGVVITVNDATVVMADVDAANGVIHVIDAVLLPPQ